MQNPCDECIVKVNCTAVCGPKRNYKRLILNAITKTKPVIGQNRGYFQTYSSYLRMLRNTNVEEAAITNRAVVIKNSH